MIVIQTIRSEEKKMHFSEDNYIRYGQHVRIIKQRNSYDRGRTARLFAICSRQFHQFLISLKCRNILQYTTYSPTHTGDRNLYTSVLCRTEDGQNSPRATNKRTSVSRSPFVALNVANGTRSICQQWDDGCVPVE